MEKMKRFRWIPLLLAMLPPLQAEAQYSDMYYHRVGDTVEQKSPIGYYQWWDWDRSLATGEFVTMKAQFGHIVLSYFYTPTPIKVIGLAGLMSVYPPDAPHDTLPDSMVVYSAGDSLQRLVAVPWYENQPHRYINITANGPRYYGGLDTICCESLPWNVTGPLYESYFDSAIYLTDSFYVGGTQWHEHYVGYATHGGGRVDCEGRTETPFNYTCAFPFNPWARYYHSGIYLPRTGWWRYGDPHDSINNGGGILNRMYLVYPIIQVDTTVPPPGVCVPVENVAVPVVGVSDATVTWDAFPNYTCVEVQYGAAWQTYSLWATDTAAAGNIHRLTGLDPALSRYGVRVRAFCGDEKTVTEWSAPVYFSLLADTSQHEGIENPGSFLSRLTQVMPNPASDAVTVTSGYPLQHIDIHNIRGILVYSERASMHHTSVSLQGLPAGTYFMTIHTLNGSTVKKLLIN